MGRLNSRHLDARRALTPRDYLADPWAFGCHPSPPIVPNGGDEHSQRIAVLQHELIIAWRNNSPIPAGALCRLFNIHRNTWSRTLLGHRWAGETVLTAVIYALTRPANEP